MRWLPLVALVACSKTSTNAVLDANPDGKPFFDARIDARLPLDAYVPRACDAPVTFADGLTPTRVIHVYPGAINGDGSEERPFGSVAAAAAEATPGTFIKLAPGTHAPNQFIADLAGTASAPIWIGGDFGTTPKIVGGTEGIHLTRPSYVVIQNLEIGFQGANAINIEDGVSHTGAHHVALVNVYVHDVPATSETTCIKAAGVDNLYIHDSRLRRCGVGIDAIGVHGAAFARNVIDSTANGAVRIRGGSTDIDVRQNRILDGGLSAVSLGGFTPLSQFRPALSTTAPNAEARRLRAFNNMVYGNDMSSAFTFDNCVDCLVAHNFVTGGPLKLLRILQNTTSQGSYVFEPTKNGLVVNNSFTWSFLNLLAPHVEVGVGASASTFTFSHNLWHCNDSPSSSTPQLPVGELGSVIGAGTGYTTALGSVYCAGPEAGAATTLPVVDGTIEGTCRLGYAPTIGPHAAGAGCEI